MSTDVKQVSDAAREIAAVGQRARRISEDLRASIAEVDDALGIAEEVTAALRSAGAELRGVLGAQTNNPPRDGDVGGAAVGGAAGGVAPGGDRSAS